MFERITLHQLEDYFQNSTARTNAGVYFARIYRYNNKLERFLVRYFQEVRKNGVYLKEKIPNPDEKQLQFYQEMMGNEFQFQRSFLEEQFKKWLPRLSVPQREMLVDAVNQQLLELSQQGKTENMLKNAYIKYMCWLYYKFEPILNRLGKEEVPKILLVGTMTKNVLDILGILSRCGCDILLLEVHGDTEYIKIDASSQKTQDFFIEGADFPKDFSLEQLYQEKQQREVLPKVSMPSPKKEVRCNLWISGQVYEDCLKPLAERGENTTYFSTLFARVQGVQDVETYAFELWKWKRKLDGQQRKVLILEQGIPVPDSQEIAPLVQKQCANSQQLLADMMPFLSFPQQQAVQEYARQAFLQVLQEEPDEKLSIMRNRAVVLVCWMRRYLPRLFSMNLPKELPVVVLLGGCHTQNEVSFAKVLRRMPLDFLILCPEKKSQCKLEDPFLWKKEEPGSCVLKKFPTKSDQTGAKTVAYQAEQNLNHLLYEDTGMYRQRQFQKAMPISLKTTFEEISILWNEEAKYRPNFEVIQNEVMVPVIFSKLCGVPRTPQEYWHQIGSLITENTVFIPQLPFVKAKRSAFSESKMVSFLQNETVQVDKIKKHPAYPFVFLREEMQNYLFEKLQQLLQQRSIKGTFTNGVEYTILSTALQLEKTLLRLLQNYDFTKQIPKIVLIQTDETCCRLEDSIFLAYLHLLGFDILLFVPTGYQSVERFYQEPLLVEHEIGSYVYDLNVPEFQTLRNQKENFAKRLFRRGRTNGFGF